MKVLNWISAPAPESADAESRAIVATIGIVFAATLGGAVFGELAVVLTLGPALLYVIYKMATGGIL
jgi:hypothetical protein